MNYIFAFLILFSFLTGALTGRLDSVVNAMFQSAETAVKVALSLIGIMSFWLGIVKIAKKAGIVDLFSKLISPLLKLIFDELPKNSPAFSSISLNIAANALGLQNAATPFGIKAMEDMQKEAENKQEATNSMCIFLAMNTAGFQLVPAVVLAILAGAGAKNPSEIILPVLIVTGGAFIFAIIVAKLFAAFSKRRA